MARTTAPLLSFGSEGQVARTLVYATWRGIPYARRYVVPANPRTQAQTTTRSTFAMLREMWKLAPTIARDPWDAFASGRQFLGFNAYIGENMRVIRDQADMTNFIGSPGARGGIPAESMTPVGGAGSGELDVTFVAPTPPDGWTLAQVAAVAFPDQTPGADFGGPMVAAAEDAPTLTVTLAGLPPATDCIVAGWLVWTKPNGDTAYSVGVTDTATTTA